MIDFRVIRVWEHAQVARQQASYLCAENGDARLCAAEALLAEALGRLLEFARAAGGERDVWVMGRLAREPAPCGTAAVLPERMTEAAARSPDWILPQEGG